jgi:hypothetical protein
MPTATATVRTMSAEGIDEKTRVFCLSAREAVKMAYVADVGGHGSLVPSTPYAAQWHDEAESLIQTSTVRPDVFFISTPDRSWFGFPE